MFERYTEKARRVIFFGRYEASNLGSRQIESEHLLLGLLREDRFLSTHNFDSHATLGTIRAQVEKNSTIGEKISASVDLPLSAECKRVLAFGAEEAERLGHKHIGTTHLLAGLLREEKCFAAEILRERGLQLSRVREELGREAAETVAEATAHAAPKLNLPAGTQTELMRQAQARGMELQDYFALLIHSALNPTADQAGAASGENGIGLKETYQRLRGKMAAEGLPCLDAVQLEAEIARRKGQRA